jgi:hypothetical protein
MRISCSRLVLALALVGCGDSGGEGAAGGGGAGATGPTYWADVKPIVDAKCNGCHVPGGIAPFALTTYEEVSGHQSAIRAAVEARTMPPWPADPGCNDYLNDRSLTDEQIATIVAWVDAGAAAGDAALEGPPLDPGDTRALSRVDVEIGMAEPYTMVEQPDEYRCFVLDWPRTERAFVTGFGAQPGNGAVVHHVIAFVAPPSQVAEVDALDAADPAPGYQCFGGPGFNGQWMGAWAPGNTGYDYPPGTGIPVEAGSKVVLQLHYNALTAGAQPDQTAVRLKVDSAVEDEAVIQPWTNPVWVGGIGMTIPPMSAGVTHTFDQDPTAWLTGGDAIVIHSPMLHMHTLGRAGRLSILRADGTEECLLSISAWDFHWQGAYPLRVPVRFNPGDEIHLECTWDNPTTNEVKWGEGTTDEMCLGGFYYTLAE